MSKSTQKSEDSTRLSYDEVAPELNITFSDTEIMRLKIENAELKKEKVELKKKVAELEKECNQKDRSLSDSRGIRVSQGEMLVRLKIMLKKAKASERYLLTKNEELEEAVSFFSNLGSLSGKFCLDELESTKKDLPDLSISDEDFFERKSPNTEVTSTKFLSFATNLERANRKRK